MASNRKSRNRDRKEITLMTILANEATADSRKLLKKYNRPDATNHADLEQKLAELYFDTADKVQLEKEMAAIHPHRKWLTKYIEPTLVETKTIEESSNADGGDCCDDCRDKRLKNQSSCPCTMNRNWEQMSGFDGSTQPNTKTDNMMGLVSMTVLFGMVAMVLIVVTKTSK